MSRLSSVPSASLILAIVPPHALPRSLTRQGRPSRAPAPAPATAPGPCRGRCRTLERTAPVAANRRGLAKQHLVEELHVLAGALPLLGGAGLQVELLQR